MRPFLSSSSSSYCAQPLATFFRLKTYSDRIVSRRILMHTDDDHNLYTLQGRSQEQPPFLRPERPLLIALEGIDLSGRTTQVQLLRDWLVAQHYRVTTT